MVIKTRKISDWLSANGQAVTDASKASMKTYLEQNLRPLQDGVYIGKMQNDGWGSQTGNENAVIGSYKRVEPWQTTNIGITAADADAIVIQHGGYRLGLALTESSAAMKWGSVQNSGSIGYQSSSELNTSMAMCVLLASWRAASIRTMTLQRMVSLTAGTI